VAHTSQEVLVLQASTHTAATFGAQVGTTEAGHLRHTLRLLAALRALVDLTTVDYKSAIFRATRCLPGGKLGALTGRAQRQGIACMLTYVCQDVRHKG
jgi:hypothetical protein